MRRFKIEGECTRETIGLAVEALIARLDMADADPDLELGGDEEPDGESGDQSWAEEPALRGFLIAGPEDAEHYGDELGDHCGGEDEGPGVKSSVTGPGCPIADAPEDSDPEGQCDEDGINTNSQAVRWQSNGAGCLISDPDLEHDGREHEDGV